MVGVERPHLHAHVAHSAVGAIGEPPGLPNPVSRPAPDPDDDRSRRSTAARAATAGTPLHPHPTKPNPSEQDSTRKKLLASPRFQFAVLLFLLNFLLGWPAAILLGSLAVWVGAKWLGLLGGLLVYAVSWVMLGIAVLIGGREVVSHSRWLVQRWLEKRREQRERRGE